MKKVRVAIMGIGTVGGGTYRILTQNHDLIASSRGLDIEVALVLDKSIDRITSQGVPKDKATDRLDDILADKSISIVVETMGGVEPAGTFILKAFSSGKSVVTANKELISKRWGELEKAAKANGVGLYYEASCAGGIPIIRTLNDAMQANHITELYGIINGTTNYILTEMTETGKSYGEALRDAQALGYAEADPTADVEGFDAMYKLSILSSLAFHASIPYTEIYREGITRITSADIAVGKEFGYTVKLLAIGKRNGNAVEVRVHPTFVPNSHPLASVRGSFNAVFLKGDFVDDVMLYGRGAGADPTGSAIVSDIVYCAERAEHVYTDFDNNGKLDTSIVLKKDFDTSYYIALKLVDRPGVLARITHVLGAHGVSINKAIQHGDAEGHTPFVFFTHRTDEASMRQAIAEIEKLDVVLSVDSVMRVL